MTNGIGWFLGASFRKRQINPNMSRKHLGSQMSRPGSQQKWCNKGPMSKLTCPRPMAHGTLPFYPCAQGCIIASPKNLTAKLTKNRPNSLNHVSWWVSHIGGSEDCREFHGLIHPHWSQQIRTPVNKCLLHWAYYEILFAIPPSFFLRGLSPRRKSCSSLGPKISQHISNRQPIVQDATYQSALMACHRGFHK